MCNTRRSTGTLDKVSPRPDASKQKDGTDDDHDSIRVEPFLEMHL